MGAVGGATGLGAALTDLGITLRNAKTAERMLKEDRQNTALIHDLVNGINTCGIINYPSELKTSILANHLQPDSLL